MAAAPRRAGYIQASPEPADQETIDVPAQMKGESRPLEIGEPVSANQSFCRTAALVRPAQPSPRLSAIRKCYAAAVPHGMRLVPEKLFASLKSIVRPTR